MNDRISKPPRALPFLMTFVKFATGFAAIIAVALFSLQVVTALL